MNLFRAYRCYSLEVTQVSMMAPPPQMECSNEECEFSTPANIPSYELVLKALELHTMSVHSSQQSQTQTVSAKTEKPKRPSLSTGLSESEWAFFLTRWERYVRQTKVSGQALVDELWSCMDSDLEKLAFGDSTPYSDQESLLKKIKTLAVTTLHPSLHAVALHQMKQNVSESTKAYSTRVRATAYNCCLEKACSRDGCSEKVSFVEETCYHVVLAGLQDTDMRDRALTQAMLGTIKDLPSLLNFAIAEESARQPTSQVGALQRKSKTTQFKCSHCGSAQHGPYNKERTSQCKAYGSQCSKCNKLHHYASLCKAKRIPEKDKPQVAVV